MEIRQLVQKGTGFGTGGSHSALESGSAKFSVLAVGRMLAK